MHIHDKGHSDPACGAQMSRKNCDMSGTCQPPSSCSRAYVTRLGPNKSRSHVTRRLIGTLTIAFWSSSTQSTLVADTPIIHIWALNEIRVLFYKNRSRPSLYTTAIHR